MRDLLDQIEQSLDTNLFYLSLMTSVTVPDIAASLEAADGKSTGRRYAAWFDKWVRPRFRKDMFPGVPDNDARWWFLPRMENPLTGEACYRFRCSLLHQGSTRTKRGLFPSRKWIERDPRFRAQVARLAFIEPPNQFEIHYEQRHTMIWIDLVKFCREVVTGSRGWLTAVEGTNPYETNVDLFARRHPDGLPDIPGVPVIG